jgi:hypothetical protein
MKNAITMTQASLLCVGVAILTLCAPNRAAAQGISGLQEDIEVSGGFAHSTGDLGLNGFNVGTGLWLDRHVSINFDYDSMYKTSTLGVLSLTDVGHTAIKNRMQDWLVGPRVFFPPHQVKKIQLRPFCRIQDRRGTSA